MLKFVTNRRRLLRKKMYKAPHERRSNQYYRENKNRVKIHQENYKDLYSPIKKRKLRPKREVSGFKMAYRYNYYNIEDIIEEDEEIE